MPHKGSCHCGAVAFQVDEAAIAGDCSICSRKGALVCAATRGRPPLLTAEDDAATDRFDRQAVEHRFCPTCAIDPFAENAGKAGGHAAHADLLAIIELGGRAL